MKGNDLKALYSLAGNRGEVDDWNAYFDPIGLILRIPPEREGYWCTPLNCRTFARTGGDGVHYSLVSLSDAAPDQLPIVMTVPMSESPNVVVGESLREFLALGCRTGYFGLEGLVHVPEETLSALERGAYDPEAEEEERRLLTEISTTFKLTPWAKPRQRLRELHLRFHSLLERPRNLDAGWQPI